MEAPNLSDRTDFLPEAPLGLVIAWATDSERYCNFFCDAFQKFAGMTLDELAGDNWTKIVHPDDLGQLVHTSEEAFVRRVPFALEARFRRHDGAYFWFLNVGIPKFSEAGVFSGYSGTNFDISQSKRMDLALLEEQHHLRSILEHSSTMIAQLDTELHYIYTNGRYADFWNKTPESLVGQDALAMVAGSQTAIVRKRFEEAAKGKDVAFEFQRTLQGKPRTLLAKYVRNLDAQGELLGFYVFADDITDIREKEKQFELILNHLPADVAYFNQEMELQYGNQAFFETSGRNPVEVRGRKMVDIIGVARFDIVRQHIHKALEGNAVSFERTESNRHWLVYLVPNLDSENRTIGIFTLELDVSALKRAEAQLRRSDRQFELALQGSQVGFWETDVDGKDSFFTENIELLLDLPTGKLRNSREAFYQRVHPDDIDRLRKTDQRQLVEPGSHVCEFRLLMADDRYRWFRSVGESEKDASGNYVRSAGTIANIDNLKEAELEAAAQVRNRDMFISVLSHELRNPLSAIRFAVDCCGELGALSDDHQNMFDIITRQTDHTSRLLADLLDVTRVAGDQMLFEKKNLDLTKLLESTAVTTRHLFESKNQNFEMDIQSGLTTFGDAVRLQQAFTNLLDNACKYSPKHATIRLSAKLTKCNLLAQQETSTASDLETDEQLIITVSDDGQGLSAEDQPRVFELFFQKERSIHRSTGGLGLGLFLVREIVLAHGAGVSVESDGEGKGCRFSVHLLPTDGKQQNNVETSPSAFASCKVVLAEDNHDARLALAHLLMSKGCEVLSYPDGMQASENLPTDAPDCAIIDIGLPRKNGLELMKEMREIESLKDTVFIALTGYGQTSDQLEILAAGFDAHLVKPIDANRLLETIAARMAHKLENQSAGSIE